jgi:hypothetical protein
MRLYRRHARRVRGVCRQEYRRHRAGLCGALSIDGAVWGHLIYTRGCEIVSQCSLRMPLAPRFGFCSDT